MMHFARWSAARSPRLFAEAVPSPASLSRRGLLAACACCAVAALPFGPARAVTPAPAHPLHARLDAAARAVEARMIAWRVPQIAATLVILSLAALFLPILVVVLTSFNPEGRATIRPTTSASRCVRPPALAKW